jgi:hypothetical protein
MLLFMASTSGSKNPFILKQEGDLPEPTDTRIFVDRDRETLYMFPHDSCTTHT